MQLLIRVNGRSTSIDSDVRDKAITNKKKMTDKNITTFHYLFVKKIIIFFFLSLLIAGGLLTKVHLKTTYKSKRKKEKRK